MGNLCFQCGTNAKALRNHSRAKRNISLILRSVFFIQFFFFVFLYFFFCYSTKIEKLLKHFRNVNQCNDFWNRRRVRSVETLVKTSSGLIPRRTRKLSRSIECQFIYANCWACDLLFVMTVISFRGERSDWDFLAFLTSQRGTYWLSQIIDREIYCL